MTAAPHLLAFLTTIGLFAVAGAVVALTRAVFNTPAASGDRSPAPECHARGHRGAACPAGVDRSSARDADLPTEQPVPVDAATPGHVREPLFIP